MKTGKRIFFRGIIPALIIAAIAFGGWRNLKVDDKDTDKTDEQAAASSEPTTKDRYFTVKRGDFNITIILEGRLDAIKRHIITAPSHARRGLEVVEIVKDRTRVKKGQVILRFSDENYVEGLEEDLIILDDAEKNLALAEKDFEMDRTTLMNNIKSAGNTVRTAQENLAKYEEQEAVRKLKELRRAIHEADLNVLAKKQKVSKRVSDVSNARTNDTDVLANLDAQVAAAKKDLEAAELLLEKARYSLRIFKQYDHPQKMRSLRQALIMAKLGLQRQLVSAEAKTVQAKCNIQNLKLRVRKREEYTGWWRKIITSLTLVAPVDGIVNIGDPESNQSTEINIGSQLNRRQVVASIPDLSSFLVRTDLPEEFRSRVSLDLPAVLTTKALPDLVMKGKIKFIAPMAQNIIRSDKNSPKVYPTEISTGASDKRLMPGMTIDIEIIVDQVKDALFVPIEAVYNREGETYCKIHRLTGVREQKVKAGRSSDSYVELVEGVHEKDEILLFRQDTGG